MSTSLPIVPTKFKPLEIVQSFCYDLAKQSKISLTKEGEDDPNILPTIFIEHIQRREIFIANLLASQFGRIAFRYRRFQAKLTLYRQYLQA